MLLAGCATSKFDLSEIKSLGNIPKQGEVLTKEDILNEYFTDEVYLHLKSNRLVKAVYLQKDIGGYYVDKRRGLLDVINGAKQGDIVLNSRIIEKYGVQIIVHEYLHHLYKLGLADMERFNREYDKMPSSSLLKRCIEDAVNGQSDKEEERFCYIGQNIAIGCVKEIDNSMIEVYNGILRPAESL